jgi:hypothetical protein
VAAKRLQSEALELERRLGDRTGMGLIMVNLAMAMLFDGDWAEALPLCRQALKLVDEVGSRGDAPPCLLATAAACAASGDPDRATVLLGATAALENEFGYLSGSSEEKVRAFALDRIRAKLDDEAIHAGLARGRSLGYNEAVALALDPFY